MTGGQTCALPISPSPESKYYSILLKIFLKSKPWEQTLEDYQKRECLYVNACEHYNSRLMARSLLGFISQLIESKKNNVENESIRSNEDRSACFTFVKKPKNSIYTDNIKVGDFLSTDSTMQNMCSTSTGRQENVLSDITSNNNCQSSNKITSSKKYLNNDKKVKEDYNEDNMKLAMNYYKQTSYSKGLLGFLHLKQQILQIERLSDDFIVLNTVKKLKRNLNVWKMAMCKFY